MPDADAYAVLARPIEREIEIKRSRFITLLSRAESEEEARAFFAEVRGRFPDARHHCTAFAAGPDRRVQRSNDDGEPSGTAGRPMLEALTLAEVSPDGAEGALPVSDTAAVVVRYFGGVLLGAGGLTRAYSSSVSEALAEARWTARRRMALYSVEAPHAEAGRIEAEVRRAGFAVTGTEYGRAATLHVGDAGQASADLDALLASLSHGEITARADGEAWIDG